MLPPMPANCHQRMGWVSNTVDSTAVTAGNIDDATVIRADVETSNGVIHVIDTVVLP